ncbi:MAG: type II toxin-antitoxin system VapC family toxin [Tepidiformaceae bacterium]
MTFVLDTMVWSEIRKPRPNRAVAAWVDSQDWDDLFMSVMTLGEIRAGAADPKAKVRQEELEAWLAELKTRLARNILSVDPAAAEVWGEIHARRSAVGKMPAFVDSMIAATAIASRMTVVTRNVRHFEDCGVPVLNPWDPTLTDRAPRLR